MGESRSPVHRIIATFERALTALGRAPRPVDVERWGVAVHHALSSRARDFHTHHHVLTMAADRGPLESLAALYHDVVYVQVDLGLPAPTAALLAPLLQKHDAGWRLLPSSGEDTLVKDLLAVFGRKPGDIVSALAGINELASGLVAAQELQGILTRDELVGLAACIEATIPFRENMGDILAPRLAGLGYPPEVVAEMVRRAVRVANADVANFAEQDAARFLDNTWKLLPEANPALLAPSVYGVRDYRVAIQRMEAFLSRLPPERIFQAWGGEPDAQSYAALVAAARANLDLAVRYLRSKVYATSLIEALSVLSGGDAPLDLFMGGLPDVYGPSMKRIEQYFPALPEAKGLDPKLQQLLKAGRASASTFDLSPSPVAAFLHAALGEPAVMAGFEDARRWFNGEGDARSFLAKQPRHTTTAVVLAASNIADTRRTALAALAASL